MNENTTTDRSTADLRRVNDDALAAEQKRREADRKSAYSWAAVAGIMALLCVTYAPHSDQPALFAALALINAIPAGVNVALAARVGE